MVSILFEAIYSHVSVYVVWLFSGCRIEGSIALYPLDEGVWSGRMRYVGFIITKQSAHLYFVSHFPSSLVLLRILLSRLPQNLGLGSAYYSHSMAGTNIVAKGMNSLTKSYPMPQHNFHISKEQRLYKRLCYHLYSNKSKMHLKHSETTKRQMWMEYLRIC